MLTAIEVERFLRQFEPLQAVTVKEISEIIARAHRTARELLMKHRMKVDEIAHRLIAEETLDSDAFNALFDSADLVIEGVVTPGPSHSLTGTASSAPAELVAEPEAIPPVGRPAVA